MKVCLSIGFLVPPHLPTSLHLSDFGDGRYRSRRLDLFDDLNKFHFIQFLNVIVCHQLAFIIISGVGRGPGDRNGTKKKSLLLFRHTWIAFLMSYI